MKFFDDCRWCSRRFIARSLLVLDAMLDEHERKCAAEHFRERAPRPPQAEQLDLFGGTK